MHVIQKHLKKFNSIHQALFDKKNEPEYKAIFKDLDDCLNADLERMTFKEIELLCQKMNILDTKLPNIDDVE